MNLHSKFAWIRAAGLVATLGLVGCDSGAPETKKTDAKVAEPAKTPEPAKVEPVKPPEPAKVEPTPDVKAADTAAPDTKSGETAGDVKAPDAKAPDAKAPDAKTPDAKVTDPKKPPESKVAAIDGKPLYEAKCKSCHAIDGKGTEAMKKKDIPDMTDKGWQTAHSKAKVIDAVTKGIDGTPMKSFKDKLKAEEIEAIAVYVKKLK